LDERDITRQVERLEVFHSQDHYVELTLPSSYIRLALYSLKKEIKYRYQ